MRPFGSLCLSRRGAGFGSICVEALHYNQFGRCTVEGCTVWGGLVAIGKAASTDAAQM